MRAKHVETLKPREFSLSNGIVIVGVLSLIPGLLPVQLGTLVAGGVLLYRRELPRRTPLIAMGLALVGLVMTATLILQVRSS